MQHHGRVDNVHSQNKRIQLEYMKTFSTLLDFIDVAPFFQFYCYLTLYIWAAFPGKTMFEKINVQIKLSFGNTDYSFPLKMEQNKKTHLTT